MQCGVATAQHVLRCALVAGPADSPITPLLASVASASMANAPGTCALNVGELYWYFPLVMKFKVPIFGQRWGNDIIYSVRRWCAINKCLYAGKLDGRISA
jgi:hypothetical protein